MSTTRALAVVAAAVLTAPAHAALTHITTISGPSSTPATDLSFEGPGGFLQTHYGLPLSGNSALTPIERAVGQVKAGSNVRRGLYLPSAATGLPAPAGSGVTSALTNFAPLSGGSDTNWTSGQPVSFSISRVGNTIAYSVGASSWAQTQPYFGQITGLEIRIRANAPTTATPSNALSLTGLSYSDAITSAQALGTLTAQDDEVRIALWNGITGDFTLSGSYVFNWTGAQPSGARLASQVKLLALPPEAAVPEPASWAMMITGFGLIGSALRRRRLALA